MTSRAALVMPAGVWLTPDAARSIVIGLASLESLLRRHRSARLSDDLQEVRRTLTSAIDALADGHVSAQASFHPPVEDEVRMVDAQTAAQILGLTPGAVRDRARRGALAACKVGGRWLVDLRQLRNIPNT